MAEFRINDQRWKVWRGALRPEPFHQQILEVQTLAGHPVIPWGGFDALNCSRTEKLAIARRIVRLHNEDLNRQTNKAQPISW